MGSIISLHLEQLTIDTGQNEFFFDHSALFPEGSLANAPYEYVQDAKDGENEDSWQSRVYVEWKRGLSNQMWHVIDRINLLGYTSTFVKVQFHSLAKMNYIPIKKNSFKQLQTLFKEADLSELRFDMGSNDSDQNLINQVKLTIDPEYRISEYPIFNEEGFEMLQPYTLLHLLNLNPQTKTFNIYWAFDDIEEGGYAPLSSFVRPLDASNKFLIVTEGSSDAKIIKHALKLLKPHIADFFTFIDMENGYPFSGTGNLYNFVKGLASISIQNNVIVLFDNDAEGVYSYKRCLALENLPHNMKILRLPDLQEFKRFRTIGPTGEKKINVNGKAVSIESFLQLGNDSKVVWKNYNKDSECYQGELEAKDTYKREFLSQREKINGYDYSKLEILLGLLIESACKLKEDYLLTKLNNF